MMKCDWLICIVVVIVVTMASTSSAFTLNTTPGTSRHTAALIYTKQRPLPRHFSRWRRQPLTTAVKWRRAVTSDVSCTQSPIQHNMTLKGGIGAGYFRKLAEHVAMQLCVELCCEEKGCDVAFMSGKNCYGVQCFSEEGCRGIPATKQTAEPVMTAHVTFKGEKFVSTEQDNHLQCSATRERSGVTLRGGLYAGNYTDTGVASDMSACVRRCCLSDQCDVSLMLNQCCFLVSCFSRQKCEVVKALTNVYKTSVVYVLRKRQAVENKAMSLQVLDTSGNQLVCKNSQVFHNTTLKGGYKAGNYTNFGKVANMSACVRRCCGNADCDAAFMLENNCFAVACRGSDACLPVHAKSTSSLAALNPRISYITSRSEEVFIHSQINSDGTCHAGIISYDVTLKGGSAAGNFTPHGKIGSMEKCIYKCCQIDGCSLAMMLKNTCFTVVCKRDDLCEKKQTPTSSNFNPKIAYVFKDKLKSPTRKVKDVTTTSTLVAPFGKRKSKKKTLLAEQLYALTDAPTRKTHALIAELASATTLSSFHSTMTSYHTKKMTSSSYNVHPSKKGQRVMKLEAFASSEVNERDTIIGGVDKHDSKESIFEGKDKYLESIGSANDTRIDTLLESMVNGKETIPIEAIDETIHKEDFQVVKNGPNNFEESLLRRTANILNHTNNTSQSIQVTPLSLNNITTIKTLESPIQQNYSSLDGEKSVLDAFLSNDINEKENSILASNTCDNCDNNATNIDFKQISEPETTKSALKFSTSVTSNQNNTTSLVEDEPNCKSSEIMRNVTLRGGIRSGKFRDRGEMEGIAQCVRICCLLEKCDLAFMLATTCFTVECQNPRLCEAVPARSALLLPTVCYVYARNVREPR